MPRQGNKGKSSSGSKSVKLGPGFPPQLLNRLLRSQRRCIPFRNTFLTMYNTSQCSRGIPNKSDSEQKQDNFYYSSPKAGTDMGVSSSESHDLTAFYEMLSASFGVLSQNTGFYPSLDRIIETMLGSLNLGPGGGSYNEPISRLHRSSLPRDRKKWETNSEPWSEVTWDGVPCFENTWVRNSWVSSGESMESWVGMKRDCLVRQLTITRIAVFPPDVRSCSMKSMEMVRHNVNSIDTTQPAGIFNRRDQCLIKTF